MGIRLSATSLNSCVYQNDKIFIRACCLKPLTEPSSNRIKVNDAATFAHARQNLRQIRAEVFLPSWLTTTGKHLPSRTVRYEFEIENFEIEVENNDKSFV